MVAGHLREKNGYYHMVLNYVDEYGKRHTPSKSTGLTVKGNKKRAEKMLSRLVPPRKQNWKQEQSNAVRAKPPLAQFFLLRSCSIGWK